MGFENPDEIIKHFKAGIYLLDKIDNEIKLFNRLDVKYYKAHKKFLTNLEKYKSNCYAFNFKPVEQIYRYINELILLMGEVKYKVCKNEEWFESKRKIFSIVTYYYLSNEFRKDTEKEEIILNKLNQGIELFENE